MKIAIIGSGAMGCVFGAKLKESGNDVYLIDVWQEHIDHINNHGLEIKGIDGNRIIQGIKGTVDGKTIGTVDLVLVFVKSTLSDIAVKENLSLFNDDTVVLTLQNGLGNMEKISQVINPSQVIAGTTAHGAYLLEKGSVMHAGKGKTVIGELDGKRTERIALINNLLNDCGLEASVSDNVISLVWDKLLVNVGINALTAITEQKNGKLVEHSETIEIMEKAVKEAMKIAKAKGIILSYDDPVARCKEVCQLTANNKSSMLQDILNKRRTEVDTINGAIVDAGKSFNIETPINEVLTQLVRFKEKNY